MTKTEVLKLRIAIEKAVQFLDNETALTAISLFPTWEPNKTYATGFKVQFNGTLYQCIKEPISNTDLTPDVDSAHFTKVE